MAVICVSFLMEGQVHRASDRTLRQGLGIKHSIERFSHTDLQ